MQLIGQLPAASLASLGNGETRGFQLGETSVFVIRHRDRLFAYLNRCPHLGIELEWQPDRFLDHSGHFIHCSTHGALFLIENGECISGPCQGDHLTPLTLETHEDQVLVYHR